MKVKGVFQIPIEKIEVIQGLLPRIYTFTVEEKIEEYKEAMSEGEQFPPIVVWDRGNGIYWLIDGMHRLLATKRIGKDTIKAEVVELENEVEARILAIEKNMLHGIPLDREEKKELTRLLYADGIETERLRKLFRVSERTIYNWVQGITRRKKDEELKRQALELRKQGLSQQEVAERLGVNQATISRWETETQSQICEPAKIADLHNANNSQLVLINPDGVPTEWGFKALSEFIEENEEELKQKPFNEAVKNPGIRDVLKFLHEAIKRDLNRFIDAPTYEKVKNYLITIYPYKELSLKARKIFFDKAQALWEKMKKEHEEEIKFEKEVLEQAKRIIANPEYVFRTWITLREDLARLGDMNHTFVYEKKDQIEDILRRHADELMKIYKQIPEATYTALSDEELQEIKEKAKDVNKWERKTQIREEVEQKLKEKRLRPVNAVVEEFVKRVEELLKEDKPTIDLSNWEETVEEIEKSITDEQWEDAIRYKEKLEKEMQELKKVKAKEKEKKETTLPPSIEDWYRNALEELLLKMGLALGWSRAFEIAEEILKKVKEYSKTMVRGW
jgi:ParB-like chromosome segregation protein Spo0J